jgi:hypothetical protein
MENQQVASNLNPRRKQVISLQTATPALAGKKMKHSL